MLSDLEKARTSSTPSAAATRLHDIEVEAKERKRQHTAQLKRDKKDDKR